MGRVVGEALDATDRLVKAALFDDTWRKTVAVFRSETIVDKSYGQVRDSLQRPYLRGEIERSGEKWSHMWKAKPPPWPPA